MKARRAPGARSAPATAPRADHDLGIRTTRPVYLDALTPIGRNRIHANRYEPTPYGVFGDMLLGLDLDHRRYVFVDLGSGKGRVLCLAAALPWKRVVGVELTEELHKTALENIASLAPAAKVCRSVTSTWADAATYEFPLEPTVVFLFNPFAAPVLSRALDNLERAYEAKPCPKLVLYYMPVLRDLCDRRSFLTIHSSSKDWIIYRTTEDPI